MTVLEELEKIDDDCDKHGIQFVKIDDATAFREYGIDYVPAIVYFENQVPNVFDGDLQNEEQILHWLVEQLEKDEIEDVTDEMLDKLIKEGKTIAVLFCEYRYGLHLFLCLLYNTFDNYSLILNAKMTTTTSILKTCWANWRTSTMSAMRLA